MESLDTQIPEAGGRGRAPTEDVLTLVCFTFVEALGRPPERLVGGYLDPL